MYSADGSPNVAEIQNQARLFYTSRLLRSLGNEGPVVDSAAELLQLTAGPFDVAEFENENGLRTDPPFPGACAAPIETRTGWLLLCLTRLFARDRHIGSIVSTIASRRPAIALVNSQTDPVPDGWKPPATWLAEMPKP